MRIPFSFKDFSQHFFPLVDALSGCWHRHEATPVFYQNGLAQLLGYRDLQDLMESRVEDVANVQDTSLSVSAMLGAMVWNAFGAGLMTYLEAETVVKLLPMDELDWKKLIAELAYQKLQVYKHYVIDEHWAHVGATTWSEATPELVEAGAPAYKFSIRSDGKAFRWFKLNAAVEKLPKDLDKKLDTVLAYHGLDKKSRRLKFYREEMIEPLFERAVDAVTELPKIPKGFEVVESEGRHYLRNRALDGYIPIAFHPNSDLLIQAVLKIFRGEAVEFDPVRLSQADDKGFRHELHTLMFDQEGTWVRTIAKISYNTSFGGLRETRPDMTFIQGKQVYLRSLNHLMTPENIPEGLADHCKARTLPDLRLSQEALPESYMAFFQDLLREMPATFEQASERVLESYRSGDLLQLAVTLTQFSVAGLDGYAWKKIQDNHRPADDEDDDELNLDYEGDQEVAMERYEQAGMDILSAFPGLSGIKPLTLGWLHHSMRDGSNFGDLRPSNPENDKSCVLFLCHLLLVNGALIQGVDMCQTHGQFNDGDECYPVAALLEAIAKSKLNIGLTEPERQALELMNVYPQFVEMRNFRSTLELRKRALEAAVSWQQSDAALWKIREEGEYLYAEDKVSLERELSSLETLMQEGRKYKSRTFTATQTLPGFTPSQDVTEASTPQVIGLVLLESMKGVLHS